jgi:cytochrome c nitrite reductase small subunit
MPASRNSRIALAALAITGGALLGATGYGFMFAEGLSYLSNDPKACVNCHIMRSQYDAWSKSSHHAVATCNDCHVPHDLIGKYMTKVEHGYRHSKGFTFQDFHEPIRITDGSLQIVEANCLRCHQSLVSQTMDSGHGMNCVHCHAGIGHGARR